MVRLFPWNTDDIDHRRRIVDSSDDDVKDAPAILSRAFYALNCVEHVHQLSRAQRHWILRTVETDVEIASDDVRHGERRQELQQQAELVEEGRGHFCRTRSVDHCKNVRAARNSHPGDEMLESDRLEWGRDLR